MTAVTAIVISTVMNYDAFLFIDFRILPEKHAGVFSILCILLSESRLNNTRLQIYFVKYEVGVYAKM
jgi:hypothetical protein